jgi:hypothetical protein
VEGDRGDLESETDQQQREAGEQQRGRSLHQLLHRDLAGNGDALRVREDAAQVGGAGGAVDERDAVQEERGRERTEHEVLDRGLL